MRRKVGCPACTQRCLTLLAERVVASQAGCGDSEVHKAGSYGQCWEAQRSKLAAGTASVSVWVAPAASGSRLPE
jgi:hypothetical protein